jgi:hypothetical protein
MDKSLGSGGDETSVDNRALNKRLEEMETQVQLCIAK